VQGGAPSIQEKYIVGKREPGDFNTDRTKARGFTMLKEVKDCFFDALMNKGYDEKSSTDLSEYLLKNFTAVFGGTQNYIPTGASIERCDIAEKCFAQWNSGKITTIQASKEMGVSVRHAYRVLERRRKKIIDSLRETRPK
jgi:Mor family transcriptional regulator